VRLPVGPGAESGPTVSPPPAPQFSIRSPKERLRPPVQLADRRRGRLGRESARDEGPPEPLQRIPVLPRRCSECDLPDAGEHGSRVHHRAANGRERYRRCDPRGRKYGARSGLAGDRSVGASSVLASAGSAAGPSRWNRVDAPCEDQQPLRRWILRGAGFRPYAHLSCSR
jgi:hypothetical protein